MPNWCGLSLQALVCYNFDLFPVSTGILGSPHFLTKTKAGKQTATLLLQESLVKDQEVWGQGSLYSSSFLKLCFPRDLSQFQHSTFSIKQEIMQASSLTTNSLCGPTTKFANNNKCIDPNNKFMLCQAWCCWRIYNSTNQTHTQAWF
jgi:hypothetical protein